MAKLSIQVAATSQTVNVFIQDSSSTTGAGLSGLVFNTSGLTAYYGLPRAASVSITLATLAAVTSAFSSGGFKEIDATNMKGWYRFDIPDAAIASGRFVSIHFQGATNMAPLALEIELTGWNNQDAVHGGMTALPNAAANAAGGLPVSAAGGLDLDEMNVDIEAIQTQTDKLTFTVPNQVDANPLSWKSGTIPAPSVTGVPIIDLKYILGTVLTETAGQIAAAFKKFFNIGTPAATMDHLILVDTVTTYTGNTPQTGDSYARIGAAGVGLSAIPDEAGVTTLLARLTSTRAGYLDNLSAGAVALASGVIVTTNNDKTGYTLSTAGQQAVADAFLARNVAGGSSSGRSVSQAIQTLRNKQAIVAGVYTCYATDDTTPLFEANVTTAAGNPMSAWAPTT